MQNQWYIARDGKQYGPVTDADLTQLVQKKELLDGDFLWRQGFDNWLPVAQVPEVRDLEQQINQANAPQQQSFQPPMAQAQQQAQQDEGASFSQAQSSSLNSPDYNEGPKHDQQTQDFSASFNQQNSTHQNEKIDRSVSQHSTEADLTNKSLSDEANKYPALHESETNQFEQRQDVQDLIEEEDDGFHKAASENSFEMSNAQLSAHSNVQQSELQRGQLGGATSLQAEDRSSLSTQPESQSFGMSTRDMSSQFQANSQVSTQLAGQHQDGADYNSASHPGQPKKKSGFSWPLGIGIGVAALFIIAIIGTFALPYIVPPETIKRQISAAIKDKTGRDVTFKGKIAYRFFPSFGIDLNNIIIHNPDEIKGPNFLQLGRLQADLKILPLLSKRVEIGRVVMHRPEVALIKDSRGRVNYEFKNAGLSAENFRTTFLRSMGIKHFGSHSQTKTSGNKKVTSFKVAQAETETLDTSDIIARTLEKLEQEEAAAEGKTSDGNEARVSDDAKGPTVDEGELADVKQAGLNTDIIIGEIEIVNGAVKLIDQKENSETLISAINLAVQAPDLAQDVTAKGTVRYLEDRINLSANLSTLGPLLKGEVVDTNLTMNSDRFEGKFDGKVRFASTVEFQGDADVQTYSLQNLLSWLGVDVPKQGYGGAYIRGKLSGTPDVFQLGNATIKVDNSVLIGALRLRPNGARPKIEAQLRTDLLDLSPYMQQQASIEHKMIDGLSGQRKTSVAAWKSDKIDVSFLNKFDALMQLSANRLIFQKHRLEKAQIGLKVNAGLMTAQLPKFSLYGGTGSLALSLNGAKARPTLKGRIGLKQIQIQPLLKNTADLPWLSGIGNVDLNIISSGNTEQQLISALNGTGKITLADGAIEGVNIPGMIRNVQSGKLLEPFSKPTEKTDFSDLNASFVINRGVVENKDLLLKGPLLRMTGKGILNLPAEQIDYGLQPKLVNSLAGQGGNAALAGINIPIRVKGPMANPKFIPDAKGLLENNGEAINNTVKSVKKAVKNLKKKKISSEEMKGLLNGLIDGNKDSGKLLDGILN